MCLPSHLSSSSLVSLLRDLVTAAPAPAGQDFAQRISLWLNAFDAVKLHTAQQAIQAQIAAPQATLSAPALAQCHQTLQAQLQRVRDSLTPLLAPPTVRPPATGENRPRGLSASVALLEAHDLPFGPLRHRYQELQRQMEAKIGPLREFVRQSISTACPGLRPLASLDAALELMLGPREQKVLAAIPTLLEPRFQQLRQQAAGTEGAPSPTWLETFQQEMHDILLAELHVRLLPIEGMADAVQHAITTTP